jgi:hypothetical protein
MSDINRLSDLLAEFERLDGLLIPTLKAGDWGIIAKTVEAKKEVKRHLADCKPLNVSRDLRIKLKKIRDNYGYAIDRFVEALRRTNGTPMSQEAEGDIDYVDALFSEGTAGYVDENFFRRKNQIGTLVASQSLPEHLVQHFTNLRECYALGLFHAAFIYCRAVIETGCFEALRRRRVADDISEFCLSKLMRRVKPFVYEPNWDKAYETIKKANRVLHSKRMKIVISEEEAFAAIQDTFAIIEELFSGGQAKIPAR